MSSGDGNTRRTRRPPARRRASLLMRLLEAPVWREVSALGLLALAALLLVSLLSYAPTDPAPIFGASRAARGWSNAAGPVGAFLSAATLQLLGLAAYLLPAGCLLLAWAHLTVRPGQRAARRAAGLLLMIAAGTGLLALFSGGDALAAGYPAGGLTGSLLARGLAAALHPAGAFIILVALLGAGLLLGTPFTLTQAAQRLRGLPRRLMEATSAAATAAGERLSHLKLRLRAGRRRRPRTASPPVLDDRGAVREDAGGQAQPATESPRGPLPATTQAGPRVSPLASLPTPPAPATAADEDGMGLPDPAAQLTLADAPGQFVSPPLSLLNMPDERAPVDEEELVEKARQLTAKLGEFGVGGSVVAIHPGPVITTFEFRPDAGIKYSRIVNLSDDLCLALKAESIRIDRLAGRSTVGIEVPNRLREIIRIREILEDECYTGMSSKLPLALGKSMDGRPYTTPLERMPHLLIAGATGSGKSVALNSMIASILFRASPDEVKFIFIDPKMLELGIYEDIPHLICPVVTDPSRAARVLKWAVAEMTRRYELLFGHGVRNLGQFNRMVSQGPVQDDDGQEIHALPYLVVVIDELADLMMVSSKEVEASIQRLAQMARAVGIHLIVATQRPSVDVLTGVIKANFPCRIAFRVSSRTDSNVILDQKGAERLLGTGDMLFLPPGAASLQRIHGALLEEPEALRLISFLKEQGKPVFNEEILRQAEEAEELSATGLPVLARDPLFEQAARLVVSMGQASVSNLQRRLALGYARAARLMDALEAEGIVGPPDGSKPRQVLVPPDYFEQIETSG